VLWVDAICINQEDTNEKNHQVQLMGDVYAQAICVIAWLGEDDDSTGELVMLTLTILKMFFTSNSLYKPRPTYRDYLTQNAPVGLVMQVISTNSGLGDPITAFNSLFKKPYWQRVWCVQELVRARSIVIRMGAMEVAGEMLANFVAWYQSQTLLTQDAGPITLKGLDNAGRMLGTIGNRNGTGQDSAALLPTLSTYRAFQATHRRDKVYGVLGMLNKTGNQYDITVKYDKSVVEVYIDVVWATAQTTKSLEVFSHVDNYPSHVPEGEFPSWVPQWHKPSVSLRYHRPEQISASSGRPLSLISREMYNLQTITLCGISFDNVTHASSEVNRGRSLFGPDDDVKALLLSLADQAENRGCQGGSGVLEGGQMCIPTAIALATAFTGGLMSLDIRGYQMTHIHGAYVKDGNVKEYMTGFWNCVRAQRSPESAPQQSSFENLAHIMCHQRRIFQTNKGYVGSGPACMRVGDHVVVLNGGRVPYVLRPISGDGREYAFMGECYVYDIMQGEIGHMLGQDGVQEQEFVLR
jgi:hypothetical protein